MAKKNKKDKVVRNLERTARKMKAQEKELTQEISTYSRMIADFEKNIQLFTYICHASVLAQDAIRPGDDKDKHTEKYTRIAELRKLDIAIKAIRQSHLEKVQNIFSLIKLVRKDVTKVMEIMGGQFIPALTDLQVATMNLFDMINQCIPKNREALEELATVNPQFKAILAAINTLNTNLGEKTEVTVEQFSPDDFPFDKEVGEELTDSTVETVEDVKN